MSTPESRLTMIETAERVSSVLSIVGASFVIMTFSLDKEFRKPINRLVFYASFGNLFANVATIISRSSIDLGSGSALCQSQAFLIQWFMPADALWTTAMACNVWLAFFNQYDASTIRRLEWKYVALCYGVPFIPALVFLFVRSPDRGTVYGPADIWCWISPNWNALRVATLYGPVWVLIITDVFIYVKVGILVLRWRGKLVDIYPSSIPLGNQAGSSPGRSSPARSPIDCTHVRDKVFQHFETSKAERYSKINESEISLPSSQSHLNMQHAENGKLPMNTDRHATPLDEINANRAALKYCFTALLFFMALLVTWVPSSVNRLYTLANPAAQVPFALNLASAMVLPLQGLWNCVIYIFTSLPACKNMFQELRIILTRKR